MLFEKPVTELTQEHFENPDISEEKEGVFKLYVEKLCISKKDLNKKILDVGSGPGYFSQYAKERGINENIYNVDISEEFQETDKSVRASVESLPFKDGSQLVGNLDTKYKESVFDVCNRSIWNRRNQDGYDCWHQRRQR